MWAISWPTTPSSSSRFILSSSPRVTASAACWGSRPVANAFGALSSMTWSLGTGRPGAELRVQREDVADPRDQRDEQDDQDIGPPSVAGDLVVHLTRLPNALGLRS